MTRRVAFLFPGQGMEGVLLGADRRPVSRTAELQPLLTARCLETLARLRDAGVRPRVVAGHSLGELAAWCATGAISREAAIEAAAVRGALMQREADRHPGSMLALDDAGEVEVRTALEAGQRHGTVVLACTNGPRAHVLSGDRAALALIGRHHPSRLLPVAGAWHSPAMRGAYDELLALLRAIPQCAPSVPLVCNRTGRLVDDLRELPSLIAELLVHPVAWRATLDTLHQLGVSHYVTVGPGKILRGLVRGTLGAAARVLTTEDDQDLARTLAELSS
jgi:[acyl-carrier-protein] S-malonyltransferase